MVVAGIGVGTVDGQTVVGDEISRFDDDRHLGGEIVVAVIGDPLRKAEDSARPVRSHLTPVRARHVADAAVLLVGAVDGQPQGQRFVGLEHEVEAVLMRRRRLADPRRLVEPLHL